MKKNHVTTRCLTCKFWDNSEEQTSWNKQHRDHMHKPYKQYGLCNSSKFRKHTFFDIVYAGNYTHKNFGCIFHNVKRL